MTLAYLLDENISPVVAEQIARKNPDIHVESVYRWQGGIFVGQTDDRVLRSPTAANLTLVTYDLKTIPPLLTELAGDSEAHVGVAFVDDSSIRNDEFGKQVTALLNHWQRHRDEEWTNRTAFLSASLGAVTK